MTATISLDAFLHGIRAAGVVDPALLDDYVQRLRSAGVLPDSAEELADQLVRDGFLTRFQSKQFLASRFGNVNIGKYQILERLGRGANGSVFLCKHQAMARIVAVKVLPPVEQGGESTRLRFEREARAGAAVDHPNIVKVFDFDHEGDLTYLVMEYVPGVTLYELPLNIGPLPVERAAHYVRQAALGLQAIHQAGLVHRDIKPANMLLDANGVVKILDLGLARFAEDDEDQLTMQHDARRVLGTADYLAPEQALNSHAVDIRADLYSLGGTLYYLLTGKPPYGDGAAVQKLVWAQTRPPVPITSLRPDLPPEIVDVLTRLLTKDPSARYQTPAEVAQVLSAWTQQPIPRPTADELKRSSADPGAASLRDLSLPGLSSAATLRTSRAPVANTSSSSTMPVAAASGLTDIPPHPVPVAAAGPRSAPPAPPNVKRLNAPKPSAPRRQAATPPPVRKAPVKPGPPQPEVIASIALPSRSSTRLLGSPAAAPMATRPKPIAPTQRLKAPTPNPAEPEERIEVSDIRPPSRWRSLLSHPTWVAASLATGTGALIALGLVVRFLLTR